MTGRGRPKRGAVPNISAAGRTLKAEPQPDTSSLHPPRGRGRSKNDSRERGRWAGGRGPGASRGRPHIIESEAIFTAGLEDGGIGRSRQGGRTGTEKIIGKLERSDRLDDFIDDAAEGVDVKKNGHMNAESLVKTYELEWISDDEYDQEHLSALLQDGFISDVHRAKDAPVVLPSRDTEQFIRIVQRKRAKVKDEPMDADHLIKGELLSQGTSEAAFGKISDYGLSEAGEYVKRCINGTSQKFLLVQLPASLSNLKNFLADNEEEEASKVTDLTIKAEGLDNGFIREDPDKEEDKKTSCHCLDGIPSNVVIGKVQILKNGRTKFLIGGKPMDIRSAIPSNLCEAIVSVDTSPDGESSLSQLRYLGGVGHSLLCSYNYNRILKPA